MPISGFDHVALPTSRPEEMIAFYGRLGFLVPDLAEWKKSEMPFFSVRFADQKINFHTPAMWQNPQFELRGPSSEPGCGDLCFVWEGGSEFGHCGAFRAPRWSRAGQERVHPGPRSQSSRVHCLRRVAEATALNTALQLATSPNVVRRALGYAVVVGAILIAINHADALARGEFDLIRGIKMGLTVLVPYTVSTLSSVQALRGRAGTPD